MTRPRIEAQRARQLAWIAVGVYLIALAVAAVLRLQGDFNVYYRAGHRVLNGLPIYRLDESSHFLYAPLFAIGFAPFAMLPLRAAQFAWYLVSAISLVALIIGSSRMLFGPGRRLDAVLIVVPLLLSARFIDNNIEHGQINLPTLALVVWAVIRGEEDRAMGSGLMLAAAILIKPFAALAALFLILERKWRPILFAIAFGAAMLLAPVLVFGPRGAIAQTAAYVQVVMSMTDRYAMMLTNQSASAAVARLASPRGAQPWGGALMAGTALELALIAAVSLWFVRTPDGDEAAARPHRFQLAALFCIMPSLVPISWKSYYAALLVPYMLLVATVWTDKPEHADTPTVVWVLLALSVILNWIPGNRPNRLALYYSAPLVSSLILLAATVVAAGWFRRRAHGKIAAARAVKG